MFRLSPNLVLLFGEAGDDPADRVRAAAAAGFDAVDMWGWDTDRAALRRAFDETGVTPLVISAKVPSAIVNPATHDEFVEGIKASLDAAIVLGSPHLVVTSGNTIAGVPREVQRSAIAGALSRAADVVAGSGVRILLENLNSRVDHVGVFLDTTAETLEIVREVGRAEVRVLYDAYHALVMGEDPTADLADSVDLIGHVQIADVPGRHEPGTGSLDWSRVLRALSAVGYAGPLGLEYSPTVETTQSTAFLRATIAGLGPTGAPG